MVTSSRSKTLTGALVPAAETVHLKILHHLHLIVTHEEVFCFRKAELL